MVEKIKVRRVSDGKTLMMTRQLFKQSRGFEVVTKEMPPVEKPQRTKKKNDDAEATGSSTRL